ncbi:MAG: diguanylate cyclase, partial [Sphaerochaetaceae bacterium]
MLLSLSIVYTTHNINPFKLHRGKNLLIGLAIGVVGILIMSRPFIYQEGLFFDSRSILIGISGMFFGAPATLLASLIMIIYRLMVGGSGVVTGLIVILSALIVGSIWHYWRYDEVTKGNTRIRGEFFLVGLVIHIAMLLALFFVPQHLFKSVFRVMVWPILLLYPLGTYLLSMLLMAQISQYRLSKQLDVSEGRFKQIFRDAPMGITVTDSLSGKSLEVNQRYLEIIGYSRAEYDAMTWMDITHTEDLYLDQKEVKQLYTGEINNYSLDKRYIRKDGRVVWVHMAVSRLEYTIDNRPLHLCMVSDITARKEWEEKLSYVYAHDPLTDLTNRVHFEEALRAADNARHYPLAVVTSDINGLKVVNDAFGTDVGDELLIELAEELKKVEQETAYTCSRIGGDAFAFILSQTSNDEVVAFIKTLHERLNPIRVRNIELTLSFGMGIKYDGFVTLDEVLKLAENDLNRSKLSENPSSRSRAVSTILSTLLEKNPREENHSRRVSELASRLGEYYGLSSKEIGELKTVGLLHDIGKIAIDETILNKEEELNAEEWEAIKRHPETGWRILSSAGEFGELATYVLTHHERYDGGGYPLGLKGE